jgi:excinuclease ABC subunit C
VGYVDEARYRDDVRHAQMFLDGKTGEVVDELVARMERASEALEFERAARYRDQIAKLRKVADRQYVTSEAGDVDVVVAATREGIACVQVFVIRGGRNLGNRSFFPRQTEDMDAATVLRAFLGQYYLTARADREIPAEIVLGEGVEDEDAMAELLSAEAGRRVRVHHRVRGDRARWVDLALENARVALGNRVGSGEAGAARLARLAEALDLAEAPERLECFDVSHTRGEQAVASCVVYARDGAVKSEYRRFNIKDITPGDDYAAMRQALTRRYGRVKREEGRLPDILLVDGGRGQLTQALEVLDELQVEGVTVVGVAKGPGRRPGLETLFLAEREALQLPPDAPALHLVQEIRDEAHRFAVAGHRGRRARSRRSSPLEELPGVGPKRRQRLLQQFGGLQGLTRAGVEDLAAVPGIGRDLARTIYDALHPRP